MKFGSWLVHTVIYCSSLHYNTTWIEKVSYSFWYKEDFIYENDNITEGVRKRCGYKYDKGRALQID